MRRFGIGGLSAVTQPFMSKVPFEYGSELQALMNLLEQHQPKRIAVNISENLAMADGLTSWLNQALCEHLLRVNAFAALREMVVGANTALDRF